MARKLSTLTVVDCGFGLEQDEELSYDTAAPRRNGSTLATLADADHVIAVGSADPVGLQRLVRGLAELSEAVPDCRPQVVVNRVRSGPINGDVEREIAQALSRYAGIEGVVFVPLRRGVTRQGDCGRSLAVRGCTRLTGAARAAAARCAIRGCSVGEPGRRRRAHRSGRRIA